ncbi:hypothetical protein KJ059_16020 [Myxococcota bacterium]|nr:hypothetical protein [Myxococcota bacterium]MCZ7618111.1 hypothetical protein [Myxococcota bacterium]
MRVDPICVLAMAALLGAAPALAQSPPATAGPGTGEAVRAAQQEPVPQQTREQEPIYGRQLMTDAEVARQRERMRAAGSEEERARIRAEHHVEMRRRAAERGVDLPETPPAGRGPGSGMGPRGGGMGSGRGAGPGAGGPR